MGFAEDKVYGHILRNMDKFKNIHVASLVDSLSCLTEADRVTFCFPQPCQAATRPHGAPRLVL